MLGSRAADHQARAGHDPGCMRFKDPGVDAAGEPEVIGVDNQQPRHGAILAGGAKRARGPAEMSEGRDEPGPHQTTTCLESPGWRSSATAEGLRRLPYVN